MALASDLFRSAESNFDKAFVEIEGILNDYGHVELRSSIQEKLGVMLAAFIQISEKADAAAQLNLKNEAILLDLRRETAECRASEQAVRQQFLNDRLASLMKSTEVDDSEMEEAKQELEKMREGTCVPAAQQLAMENRLLQHENSSLRESLLHLQHRLSSASLALYYMEKELAGRVQQLQLILRNVEDSGLSENVTDTDVWLQLEEELELQRHKALVDLVRCRVHAMRGEMPEAPPPEDIIGKTWRRRFKRSILVVRDKMETSMGLTVTGGQEYGTPLIISGIRENSPAGRCGGLYVGDALISANGKSLEGFSHEQLVNTLQELQGEVMLEVVYCAGDQACPPPARLGLALRNDGDLLSSITAPDKGSLLPARNGRQPSAAGRPPNSSSNNTVHRNSSLSDMKSSALSLERLQGEQEPQALCLENPQQLEQKVDKHSVLPDLLSRSNDSTPTTNHDHNHEHQHQQKPLSKPGESSAQNQQRPLSKRGESSAQNHLTVGKLEARAVQAFLLSASDSSDGMDLFSV